MKEELCPNGALNEKGFLKKDIEQMRIETEMKILYSSYRMHYDVSKQIAKNPLEKNEELEFTRKFFIFVKKICFMESYSEKKEILDLSKKLTDYIISHTATKRTALSNSH